MDEPLAAPAAADTRAGYVALVGKPNVGKSTLLNALTGEKLSIVTPRAQTTRERVLGILTSPRFQIIFVDTPGLLAPRDLLQESMRESALAALRDADTVLLLLDATRPGETLPDEEELDRLRARSGPLLVAINKTDEATSIAVEELAAWSRERLTASALLVSALLGDGLQPLLEALVDSLPVSPFFYPTDEIAVQSVRFFVAELVRETLFEQMRQEVPHAAVVKIEEFAETREPLYIRATIYVERPTQKAIVIGEKGAGIKAIGRDSRAKIESFLQRQVYLDLWVKVLPKWRRKADALRYLGYTPPEVRD